MPTTIRGTVAVHLIRYDRNPADALAIPCVLCGAGVSQPCKYDGNGMTLTPRHGGNARILTEAEIQETERGQGHRL